MDIENAKAQMRKGVLDMCVLAVIAEQETYPPEIIKRLKGTDLVVVEGTLYPLITRLKNDGLVDSIWREGKNGPPRKYFTITSQGRVFLSELSDSWGQFIQSVNQVIERANTPPIEGGPVTPPPKPLNLEPLKEVE
jgi:PadR family transcriptional regulator, regulatory protein PadR